MKFFATKTMIQAKPEVIWSLLTNAADYPTWNSTVDRVDGQVAPGERITVHASAAKGRAFPLTVQSFDAPRRMVWSGGMPLGLFSGRRTFTLTPQQDGVVEFSMREEFTGLLAPLITKSIPDLQPAFDTFAADLKRRAEQGR
ncbi:MAG: SRPBCC domain-containing protein [Gemmatimonadetes bacterium]|nr:SRPBCC domain-containing protein [Gemmatimonadota bacterium]MCC6770383.1 SRPBCC domain-containing protein [Gemmatimonadaceae bacterium]